MKRIMGIAAAVAVILAATACAPPPEPTSVKLTCSGLHATTRLSPGVTYEPATQKFTLSDRSRLVGCTDELGLGITGGRLVGTTLSFPSLDCYGTGAAGVGSGTVRWSDGSLSAFTASIELVGPLDAELALTFTSGQFAGSAGTISVAATPTSGDCIVPIRSELLEGGELVVR